MAMTRAHDLWIFPTFLQHNITYLFYLRFSHGYILAGGCAMDLYRQGRTVRIDLTLRTPDHDR